MSNQIHIQKYIMNKRRIYKKINYILIGGGGGSSENEMIDWIDPILEGGAGHVQSSEFIITCIHVDHEYMIIYNQKKTNWV